MNFLLNKISLKLNIPLYYDVNFHKTVNIKIDISPKITILELKSKIIEKYYSQKLLTIESIELSCNNNVLENERTIQSYDFIKNKTEIKLTIDYFHETIMDDIKINITDIKQNDDNIYIIPKDIEICYNINKTNNYYCANGNILISSLKKSISQNSMIKESYIDRVKLMYKDQELDDNEQLYYYHDIISIFGLAINQINLSSYLNTLEISELNSAINKFIRLKINNQSISRSLYYYTTSNTESSQSSTRNNQQNTTNSRRSQNSIRNVQNTSNNRRSQETTIPKKKLEGHKINVNDNCSICFSPLYCVIQNENKEEKKKDEELYAFKNCQHLLHYKCFEEFYNSEYYKNECPVCKCN